MIKCKCNVNAPLLFNLSLEPLAQAIRQCSAIVPISCMNTSHKISLYTDDVLLYISNITDSVKECLKLFDTFGKLSGYKINWNKSILMPLNLAAKSEIQNLPTTIPVLTILESEFFLHYLAFPSGTISLFWIRLRAIFFVGLHSVWLFMEG